MSLAGRATLALVLLLACAAMACAHPMNLSTARIVLLADRQVEVEVAVRGSDADRMAGTAVFDAATGQVRVEALAGSAGSIAAYVLSMPSSRWRTGGHAAPARRNSGPDGDGVAVRARWPAPRVRARCSTAPPCSPTSTRRRARWCWSMAPKAGPRCC